MQPQEKERFKTTSSSLHHRQLGNRPPGPRKLPKSVQPCDASEEIFEASPTPRPNLHTPPLEIRPYDQVILAIGFVNKYLQQIQCNFVNILESYSEKIHIDHDQSCLTIFEVFGKTTKV